MGFWAANAQNKYDIVYLSGQRIVKGKIIPQEDSLIVQVITLEGTIMNLWKTEIDSIQNDLKFEKLPGVRNVNESDVNIPRKYMKTEKSPKSIIIGAQFGYAPDGMHKAEKYSNKSPSSGSDDLVASQGNSSSGFVYGLNLTRVYSRHISMFISMSYLQKSLNIYNGNYEQWGGYYSSSSSNETTILNKCLKISHAIKFHDSFTKNFIPYFDLGYALSFNDLSWESNSSYFSASSYTQSSTHSNTVSKITTPLQLNFGIYFSVGAYIRLSNSLLINIQYSDNEIFAHGIKELHTWETTTDENGNETNKEFDSEDNTEEYYNPSLSTRSFNIGLCYILGQKVK